MKRKIVYPTPNTKNGFTFRVWAPHSTSLQLVLNNGEKVLPMQQEEFGYWYVETENTPLGTRYKYRLNDNSEYPDPASLSQPDGVHEASAAIRIDQFPWTDQLWKNIPLQEMIIYELHTGTFTDEGTFEGIIKKLDYLKDVGINTIELLPVAQFSGHRNWGYDGVYPFAAQSTYGGADKLMRLVNECHRKEIAVILDVVYNHFGPEGNYVGNYSTYFTNKYSTPWGDPINFDGAFSDGVRNYVIQNALMWCRDFHIDGLRLDAVHSIFDFGTKHILQELAEGLQELSMHNQKQTYLIAESHLNDVKYISPYNKGGYGLDAQWTDDFHHAIHSLATGEQKGYYADFGEPEQLGKAMKEAFVYDGQYSAYRKQSYGNSTENNSGEQFVCFNQNHDQIGNRKNGERLLSLTNPDLARLIAGAMFITPNIPMLFMGEEYGETNPFYYFVSHEDEALNKLVREGRKKEFESFFADTEEAPNPDIPETFEKSKLSWNITQNPSKSAMLAYYKALIHLRKTHPVLRETNKDNMQVTNRNKLLIVERWQEGNYIIGFLNFHSNTQSVQVPKSVPKNLLKVNDSSDRKWNGTAEQSAADTIKAGDLLELTKHSMVLYST